MGREKLRKMRKGSGGFSTGGLHTLQSLVEGLPERGDRPAVLALHKEGAERWSYGALADHALRLAHGLAGAGIERGDRVTLLAPNRPEWVAACLAVMRAGAVAVPLDAQLGEEALEGILEGSEAKLIFTTSEKADFLERLDTDASPVLLDAADDDERGWRRLLADTDTELPEVAPEDVAALFYTSGTTGAAKGVPLSHRNIVYQLETLLGADLVDEHDRLMLPLPLHHVYPFVVGMFTPLAAGLPVVFPSSLTGPQLVRALNEGEVTLIVGVPRLYSALYSGIEDRAKSGGRVAARLFDVALNLCANLRDRAGLDVGRVLMRPLRNRLGPKLKTLASGGAPLDPALARKLEALGWRVGGGYGLTETSPLLSLKKPDGKKLASVGRPVSGTEILIDPSAMPDEESGERRTDSPYEEGEILARGPGVFSGYRDLPDKTAEVLTEDGWFRTGDLGYFDDEGYLYVTGRASTLIVTEGGKNVQPEDVEAVYSESPVIGEIGVLQKDNRLVAVIVPEQSEIKNRSDDAEGAIREAVEQGARRLPSYQRLSDYAVTREPLEYTQLGKLRRHLLEERYDRAKAGDEGEAPGPIPVEEMPGEDRALLEDDAAREVWELLARRYPDRRLTPNTSPQLDLGVDSMEWVNLTMEIGERAGVELDEEAIGRVETVRDLLREATEAGEAVPGASPVERPEETLDETQKRRLEPLSPAESAASRGMFALNRVLMRVPFRLRVRGLENLPRSGPFVLAPNHVSYLDSFALAAALDDGRLRETYWAGWVGAAFGNPVTRLVSRLARVVPIDPARAGTSSLAFGAAVLGRGKNLVWFPEGERSWTGELGPFKRGLGVLLEHYRVPVVPVFVEGTYGAMPRGSALVRPRRITVTFGQPLNVDELERRGEGEEPRDRIVEALRDRIAEMVEGRACDP